MSSLVEDLSLVFQSLSLSGAETSEGAELDGAGGRWTVSTSDREVWFSLVSGDLRVDELVASERKIKIKDDSVGPKSLHPPTSDHFMFQLISAPSLFHFIHNL